MDSTTATEHARQALARIEASERPEVWIARRDPDEVLADAEAIDQGVASGERLPLAGVTVAVSDDIDVAGLVTTAACPGFARRPRRSAAAVARLQAAGAIVLGKANLDQFGIGLSGTRSPHGAVRDGQRPEFVAGGAGAGAAVAVALGLADLGLVSDDGGGARVPAAFQGIVAVRPTRGLIPGAGALLPRAALAVLARDLGPARRAAGVMARQAARGWPPDAPLGASRSVVVALPRSLPELSSAAQRTFAAAAERLAGCGHELVEVDIQAHLAAARHLRGRSFIAERYSALGSFVERHPAAVDPHVCQAILGGGQLLAHALVEEQERLEELRAQAREALGGAHMLMLPTTTSQPRILDVEEDPAGWDLRLGLYAGCACPLDLCAVAVPAGTADGGHFGLTLLGAAFADALVGDVAADLLGEGPARAGQLALRPRGVELFVVGAHRSGQPLNPQLACYGARLLEIRRTEAQYRLHRLVTELPKPGLVRVEQGGAAVEGELWEIPREGFAAFAASLPSPMTLGRVRLEGGGGPLGILCEPAGLIDTEDITQWGSWPGYLRGGGARGIPASLPALAAGT